jgi:hypothetical protein
MSTKPAPSTPAKPAAAPAPQATPATPARPAASSAGIRSLTEKLAYELWEQRGRKPGHDVQDWLDAEKMAKQKLGL